MSSWKCSTISAALPDTPSPLPLSSRATSTAITGHCCGWVPKLFFAPICKVVVAVSRPPDLQPIIISTKPTCLAQHCSCKTASPCPNLHPLAVLIRRPWAWDDAQKITAPNLSPSSLAWLWKCGSIRPSLHAQAHRATRTGSPNPYLERSRVCLCPPRPDLAPQRSSFTSHAISELNLR